MSIHFKNLHISHFRGMQDATLPSFNTINIFTGLNDSGKTSLLELLSTAAAPSAIKTWLDITRAVNTALPFYEGIIDLFTAGYQDFFYKIDTAKGKLIVKAKYLVEESFIPEPSLEIRSSHLKNRSFTQESNIPAKKLTLSVTTTADDGVETGMIHSIYDIQRVINITPIHKSQRLYTIEYLPPLKHLQENPYLSDILQQAETKDLILAELQKLDSSIQDIQATVTNENTDFARKIFQIKTNGNYLPLHVFGDGVKKGLLLMSAIISARNGILLVDEFETALHATTLPNLVQWLFTACKQYNVQLFMTTHSKDALDAVFNEANPALSDINLYTLLKKKDKTVSRCLTGKDALHTKDVLGLELR